MRALHLMPAALAAVTLLACGSYSTSPGTPAPATAAVNVSNNSFSPATVTISSGGTVTWSWTGNGHNVVGDNGIPARSGPLADAPTTYAFKFDTPGTYRYYCEVHGQKNGVGMSGTVVVQ
jgi:plastocyanin